MLASQENLLPEDRTFIPRPDEDAAVEVAQYQVGLRAGDERITTWGDLKGI